MSEEKVKTTRSSRYQTEIEVEEVDELKETKLKKEKKKEQKQINEEPETKKQHPILNKIILTIIVIFLTITAYSTLIEPKFINVKEYKIESNQLPESFHGLKIVQLSDIHYGTTTNSYQLNKIIKKVNELKPDIIVFTGDLQDKNIELTEESKEELIIQLNDLKCSLYKYAIYGDEDLDNKNYKEIMESTDFTILDNKSIPLYYKDQTPIIIAGFNPIISNPTYEILGHQIDEQDINNYYKIVLSHEPDSIDNFIDYNPNLVLSGHSLGGIIDLKFTKPLLLPENGKKYYKNHNSINNTELYISNGLGTNSLNLRLLNPPSISLYRFYKTK